MSNYATNPYTDPSFNYFLSPQYLYPNTNFYPPPAPCNYPLHCYVDSNGLQQHVNCGANRANGMTNNQTHSPMNAKSNCHCSNCNYEIYQFVELHDVGCSQSRTDLKPVPDPREERPVKDENCVSNTRSLPETLTCEDSSLNPATPRPDIETISICSDRLKNPKILPKPLTNCVYYETKNKRVSGLKDIFEQKKNKTNLTISHPIVIFDHAPRSDNGQNPPTLVIPDEIGDQKCICQKCNKIRLPISSSIDEPKVKRHKRRKTRNNKVVAVRKPNQNKTPPLFQIFTDKLKKLFSSNLECKGKPKKRFNRKSHTLRKTRPVLLMRGKTYIVDDKDSFLKRHPNLTPCP